MHDSEMRPPLVGVVFSGLEEAELGAVTAAAASAVDESLPDIAVVEWSVWEVD